MNNNCKYRVYNIRKLYYIYLAFVLIFLSCAVFLKSKELLEISTLIFFILIFIMWIGLSFLYIFRTFRIKNYIRIEVKDKIHEYNKINSKN